MPGGAADWTWNHPSAAAAEFAAAHPEFIAEEPPRPFLQTTLEHPVTYWPGAWLRRR